MKIERFLKHSMHVAQVFGRAHRLQLLVTSSTLTSVVKSLLLRRLGALPHAHIFRAALEKSSCRMLAKTSLRPSRAATSTEAMPSATVPSPPHGHPHRHVHGDTPHGHPAWPRPRVRCPSRSPRCFVYRGGAPTTPPPSVAVSAEATCLATDPWPRPRREPLFPPRPPRETSSTATSPMAFRADKFTRRGSTWSSLASSAAVASARLPRGVVSSDISHGRLRGHVHGGDVLHGNPMAASAGATPDAPFPSMVSSAATSHGHPHSLVNGGDFSPPPSHGLARGGGPRSPSSLRSPPRRRRPPPAQHGADVFVAVPCADRPRPRSSLSNARRVSPVWPGPSQEGTPKSPLA